MTTMLSATPEAARPDAWTAQRALALVERNLMMYRRSVVPLAFGLVEPLMYLLTIGFGVGSLVGTVPGVDVRYPVYVAPAILATTAMNTAFNQTSFGVFTRIKVDLTYEAIVPTPLGLLLAVPAAALVGFAFAAGGLAVTTFIRDFPDFQLIQLVMLPMYLFATTFYPLSTYPGWLRPLIEALPLYQSIQLIRGPALGTFDWPALAFATCYLAVFGTVAMIIATRRLGRLLLK
jgi:lipooligosaccharide transport system permease protein